MNKKTTAMRLKVIRDLAIQDLEEDMEDVATVAISREDVTALDLAMKTVELYGVPGAEDPVYQGIASSKDLIMQIAAEAVGKYLTGTLMDVISSDVAEAVIRNLPAVWETIAREEIDREEDPQ